MTISRIIIVVEIAKDFNEETNLWMDTIRVWVWIIASIFFLVDVNVGVPEKCACEQVKYSCRIVYIPVLRKP